MSGDDKRKQRLYFPEATLKEITDEATRQDRSISWIIQRAWKAARETMLTLPRRPTPPEKTAKGSREKEVARPSMKSSPARALPSSSSLGVTRSQLVETLARKLTLSGAQAEAAVSAVFAALASALENGARVEIRGVGSFWVKEYRAYVGRNPRTGTRVEVPPKRLVRFKPSKAMAVLVNRASPPAGAKNLQ
jgi:integration host factor subunit beta